jgi:predicted ATPase
MATSLTSFRVVGLHGRKTVEVPILNNRLVLVGENGAGKSTLANLIYYFLTRQWERVREHRFEIIEATLNGRKIAVTPAQLDEHIRRHSGLRRGIHLSRSTFSRWNSVLSHYSLHDVASIRTNPGAVANLARQAGLPVHMAAELLDEFQGEEKESTEIQRLSKQISEVVSEQFLYLPTYRRIEHDLQHIFKSAEIDIDELRKSLVGGGSEAYIELVQFGMEDVEEKIQTQMVHLKESLRAGLNKLTGSYLRDVIQGAYGTVSFDDLRTMDKTVLDSILARIPDETLPQTDKNRLKQKITRFALASYEPNDNIIAHFLLKLLALYEEQQKNESDVREFVEICNVYLTDKRLKYDNSKYEVAIELKDEDVSTPEQRENLKLSMLSSGEKQIISLFSHIYLSSGRRFFVIIDEPELSLSVGWQRRFLPDILNTGRCDGLIAVTHSPFIWENDLGQYVHSLPELTIPAHDVR